MINEHIQRVAQSRRKKRELSFHVCVYLYSNPEQERRVRGVEKGGRIITHCHERVCVETDIIFARDSHLLHGRKKETMRWVPLFFLSDASPSPSLPPSVIV